MANWPLRKLKEYPLEIIDGDRGKAYPQITDFNCKGYCLFLNAGNVTSTGFNFETCVFITEEKDNELRKGKLESHDIVITTRGTVGNIAYYSPSIPFKHIRINSGMVILRPNVEFIIPEFLYYSLISPFFKNQLKSFTSGSAQPQLPIRDLSNISLYLPSLQQQKSIIEKIKILDQKIELNRKMNETLEQMAQAVFQDWFVDFGPVKRKAKGITDPGAILGGLIPDTAKAQEIASLFPDQFAEDGLPEGWSYSSLNEIAVKTGNQILPQEIDPETIYIGLGHITRRSLAIYDWDQASKVTSNKLTFKKGDILFGKLRPYFHKVVIAPQNGISSTDIIPIQAIRNIYYSYLVCLVSSNKFVDYTDKSSTGTRMPRTSWAIMAKYEIPKPSDAIFEAFNHITSKHFLLMQENVLQNHTLAEMRDLLLPKLMSGEISVDELEKKMGGVL